MDSLAGLCISKEIENLLICGSAISRCRTKVLRTRVQTQTPPPDLGKMDYIKVSYVLSKSVFVCCALRTSKGHRVAPAFNLL